MSDTISDLITEEPETPTTSHGDVPPWECDPATTAGFPAGDAVPGRGKGSKTQGKTKSAGTDGGDAALSDAEVARFKELDQLVYRHSIGYLMVADALKEIGALKLYRGTYKSFDDYCLGRHGFGRQQGNNLVQSASLMERIKPHLEDKAVVAPVTEGVIRELRRIKDDEQCALAYVEAVQLAGGDENVTPKDVRAAVRAAMAQPGDPVAPKPDKKTTVREHLKQLREAMKAGKPAEELEPLLDALARSLGL